MSLGLLSKEEFDEFLRDAVYGRWFVMDEAKHVLDAVEGDDIDKVRSLVREQAGVLGEVSKKRHRHNPGGTCWCEYGNDPFEVIREYHQTHPITRVVEG